MLWQTFSNRINTFPNLDNRWFFGTLRWITKTGKSGLYQPVVNYEVQTLSDPAVICVCFHQIMWNASILIENSFSQRPEEASYHHTSRLVHPPLHPQLFFFILLLSTYFLCSSYICCPCPLAPPSLFSSVLFFFLLPLCGDAVMYLFTAQLLPLCHHSILAVGPFISSSSSFPPAITLKPVFQSAFLSPTKYLLFLSGPPFGEGGRPPS